LDIESDQRQVTVPELVTLAEAMDVDSGGLLKRILSRQSGALSSSGSQLTAEMTVMKAKCTEQPLAERFDRQ